MSLRTLAGVLLTVVIITGAIFLGIGAYNAGVTQGLIESGQVTAPGPYVGGPYVGGWGYGYGGGPGFGLFGFLATIFFIFLVIGLVRAAFGRKRSWGGGGWGGPRGWERWDRHEHGPWEARAREIHDEWHRTGGRPTSTDPDQPAS
jgi:hypothetical protein